MYDELTRDNILCLLTDDEAAQVSFAETSERLLDGDEFIDLGRLRQGVQRASSRAAVGRMVPRKALTTWTWNGILAQLGRLGVPYAL